MVITISVIMTTYNGERFLSEQLDSIRNQTRQPDEVLIIDDRSTDHTFEIACKYIEQNALSDWSAVKNEVNLGWKRNFVNAMKQATSDIVFLADQDDIWKKDKIEVMTKCFENNDNILLLASNCELFYTNEAKEKNPPFYSLKNKAFYLDKIWANKGFISVLNKLLKDRKTETGELLRIPFDTGLFSGQRQGCVMAYRRSLFESALPYWFDTCPHDTLLWLYAAANDGLYLLEKNTIKYRHHSSNTGFNDTLGTGLTAKKELAKIKEQIKQIEILSPVLKGVNEETKKVLVIKDIINYLCLREKFLTNKRLKDGIAVIKRKGKVGNRQVLFDWLLAYMT